MRSWESFRASLCEISPDAAPLVKIYTMHVPQSRERVPMGGAPYKSAK